MIINSYRYAASSTLLDGLVSWWSMDEASGTRVDSHGSNDLTDVNTVGSAAGKLSSAASFVQANTEYLIAPTTTDLLLSNSRTYAAWVNFSNPAGGVNTIFGARTSFGMQIRVGSGKANFIAWNNAFALKEVSSTETLLADTWYLVVATYDQDAQEMGVSVDSGTPVTVATDNAAMRVSVEGLRVGGAEYADGLIDEAAVWSRVLTAAEITELYNGGSGIGYPG